VTKNPCLATNGSGSSTQSAGVAHWSSLKPPAATCKSKTGTAFIDGADGGIDLLLGRDGNVTVVQCKRRNGAPVGVREVRELYGVLHHRRASAAKLVATTSFTPDAVAFAENKPIELVDADSLLHLIHGVQTSGKIVLPTVEADNLTPDCPKCGSVMVLREAKRGANVGQKFWGCPNFPKCRSTRPL
jgi:restriction system protein